MDLKTFEYNEAKFKELVIYIAENMDGDPSFGATKLNKVLFYSDFLHYREVGEPITGAVYFKLPYGPAPRRMLPVQRALVAAGEAQVVKRSYLGRMQKRLVALRDADRDVFKPAELKLVDQVIDALTGVRAVDVSDMSHDEWVGWQVAALEDDIPYESAFLSAAGLNGNDRARAAELAEAHGWAA